MPNEKMLTDTEERVKRIERDPKMMTNDRIMAGREDILWLCDQARQAVELKAENERLKGHLNSGERGEIEYLQQMLQQMQDQRSAALAEAEKLRAENEKLKLELKGFVS